MPGLQPDQYIKVILDHNNKLIAAADKNIAKFKEMAKDRKGDWPRSQYTYWTNVRAALLWSSSIAQQTIRQQIDG